MGQRRRRAFSAICVSSILVVYACGDDDAAAPVDAGTETSTPKVDGSPPKEDSANCEPGASVTDNLKDAEIGDGASTSGICLGCAVDKCKAPLTTCLNDCDCQRVARGLFDCYSLHGDAPICNGFKNGPSGTPPERPNALALYGCLDQNCSTACAKRTTPDGGTDAADAADASDGD